MTRRRMLGVLGTLVLLSMSLTQCTSLILCTQYYDVLYEKRGSCPGSGGNDIQKQVKDCEKRLSTCTDTDRKKVADTITCLKTLEVCTPSHGIAWGVDALSCYSRLSGLSSECAQAFTKK